MKTNSLGISTFFFISFLVLSCRGLTINTYEIRDLESNNTSYFQNEAALWAVTNTVGSVSTSQCSGIWLLGGYHITTTGAVFSKTYTSLPAHNVIYFSIYVWYIDMNEQADLFQIYFDSQYVQDINSNRYSSFGGLDYCGASTWDYARSRVEGSVAHNTSTLTFKILSKLNSSTNAFSLGFRDLNLLFGIRGSPATSACMLQSATYSSDVSCVCPQGQYDRSGSLGCTGCSSSCKTCMGSSASDCTACPSGSSFDGNSCFQCHSTCSQCNGTLETDCIRCPTNSFLYWNGTCQTTCPVPLVVDATQGEFRSCGLPCGLSDFYYENSTCHSTCAFPFTQILQGDLKLCNFNCLSSAKYLYANGSCISSCPSSTFDIKSQGVENYCDFKCPESAKFLYSNSSCLSNCPASGFDTRSQGTENYCDFKCPSSSEYLYSNGSCISSCPSSAFSTISQGTENYCDFKCSLSSEYLFSNGSCISSCPPSVFDTRSQGTESYCDFKCPSSSDYLYSNGSCLSSCANFFLSLTQGVERYCNFPCSATDYFYENGSCIATCNFAYQAVTRGLEKYCNQPCINGEFYDKVAKSCVSSCLIIEKIDGVSYCKNVVRTEEAQESKASFGDTLQSIFTGSAMIGGILRPNNMNSAFLVGLAKLLKYVHYLDVAIPQEIRDSMSLNHTGGFCITQMFSYNMPESLKEQFSKSRNIPFYIEQSGVHSSFLVNHWQTMSTYLFLFLISIFSGMVEKLVLKTKWEKLAMITTRIRIILKWNFVLFIFFNTYDDITFFAILELKTLHLDSFLSALSFVLCLGILLLATFLLYRGFKVCRESMLQSNHPIEANFTFYKKWEDYQVLHAGLKNDSWIKQYYLLIYILRIVLCYILAGALYNYPVVQTVQFLLLSFILMGLLIKTRPIADPFAFLVNVTYEILILIVNICLVILAISSASGRLERDLQYSLSRTILICNSLVNMFSNLFSWGYIIMGIIIAYKTSKRYKTSGKTVWLSVPVSPYSNPGMDYSDLTYWENGEPPKIMEKAYPKRVRIISKKKVVPVVVAPESDFEDQLKNIPVSPSGLSHDSSLFSNLKLSTSRQISNRNENLIYRNSNSLTKQSSQSNIPLIKESTAENYLFPNWQRNNHRRKSSLISGLSPSNQETTIIINSIDDFEEQKGSSNTSYMQNSEKLVEVHLRRRLRRSRNSFLSSASSHAPKSNS